MKELQPISTDVGGCFRVRTKERESNSSGKCWENNDIHDQAEGLVSDMRAPTDHEEAKKHKRYDIDG
jgi:hypothetical protein